MAHHQPAGGKYAKILPTLKYKSLYYFKIGFSSWILDSQEWKSYTIQNMKVTLISSIWHTSPILFQDLLTISFQIWIKGKMAPFCLSFQYQDIVKSWKQSHTDLRQMDDTTENKTGIKWLGYVEGLHFSQCVSSSGEVRWEVGNKVNLQLRSTAMNDG